MKVKYLEISIPVRPLIFLDIDGVLNTHLFNEHPDIQSNTINQECVEQLNKLIEATNPEIVLSSAWRYMMHGGAMTLIGFEYLLRTHGVMAHGRLIDYTARDEDIATRGEQIARWLDQHGRRPYIVIDDGGRNPDTGEWSDLGLQIHPVVWTQSDVGLTEREVAKALECLAIQNNELMN